MYDKVFTDLKFKDRELSIIDFWKKNDIFKKSIELRKNNKEFTFYDGPPTANGKPHIGHIITRVYKDIIPRYKTMKGYKVLRKAGWDTHGLPVELGIEKELGISGKSQIEEYGIEKFIKKCKESVWKYEEEWRKMSDRVGYWVDMDNPYVTYYNSYIESIWWAFKKIWDQGLIYKGYKVVPYCPRCGTALSSHEVSQGYKTVADETIFIKFELADEKDTYFLVWTTTPWTLPSNVALTVNPKETYIKVKCGDEKYILAKALAPSVLDCEYEVLEEFVGKDLEYKKYIPLYNFELPKEDAYYVCVDDFVTLTDGTGIVHTAPAFGEDDSKVGMKYNLPFLQLVNAQGRFVDSVKNWKGMFVKEADKYIVDELKERNMIYKTLKYEHSYPHCWRCDTPLLYYARDTWFIKMTELRDELIANNNTINWIPESIGKGRFGDWLENVIDWGISRERYWGTPLPIWECECGNKHVIGSIDELKKLGEDVPEDIELHKPYIDNVVIKCPECGKTMKRVSEVLDCWLDSGSMPFAQWHYPFENEEIFNKNYPADFISEAVDQTRGWFYTLLAMSTALFNKAPFKNVIVLGHVNDKDGKKMSKHLGNVVDPWDVLDKQGADAVRWYFCTNSSPWLPSKFYDEAVSETQRRFMGTLWNTYAFYVLYAEIDQFDPTKYNLDFENLPVIDKWILSKLNSLIKTVDENLNSYKVVEAARSIEEFVDELSNWYIRRNRERYWVSEMPQDKVDAYMTLYHVLLTISKLCAPFVPFMSESIYQNIVKKVDESAPESVHLCDFPKVNEDMIDKELEKNMDNVLKVVALGRLCRNISNIKNRQPLSAIYVRKDFDIPDLYRDLILEELNIKKLEYMTNEDEFVNYKVKPNRRILGPKYGKILNNLVDILREADGNPIVKAFDENKTYKLLVEGQEVELSRDDVLIETVKKEGFVSQVDGDYVVVIDTNLSKDLIEEGFVREVVSKIQTMRKEADFEILDKIKVTYNGDKMIEDVIEKFKSEILKEVLALDIVKENIDESQGKEWNINGYNLKLKVER